MKKKRGLKRYYKKLSKSRPIDYLDLSGGDNSWFDFYHIHIDNIGLGNKSWKSRKQHLDSLFQVAKELEEKLSSYPKDFQYWIEISENDSREDSIYIHTENPYGTKFPISIEFDEKYKSKNKNLINYLDQQDYNLKAKILFDHNNRQDLFFFLTKNKLGLKLV